MAASALASTTFHALGLSVDLSGNKFNAFCMGVE